MSDINDGGPAFPTGPNKVPGYVSQGMSLRDWFAGQAMTVFADRILTEMAARDPDKARRYAASLSYAMADAMLAARSEKQ